MTPSSVFMFVQENWGKGLLYIFLTCGVVQLSPIKINPLSWIAKKIGNALNADISAQVTAMSKKLDKHIAEGQEEKAIDARVRILRAADDISNGRNYSQEHYKQMLLDAKFYTDYAYEHPEFENNITPHAIKLISDTYDEKLRNNDFLY